MYEGVVDVMEEGGLVGVEVAIVDLVQDLANLRALLIVVMGMVAVIQPQVNGNYTVNDYRTRLLKDYTTFKLKDDITYNND